MNLIKKTLKIVLTVLLFALHSPVIAMRHIAHTSASKPTVPNKESKEQIELAAPSHDSSLTAAILPVATMAISIEKFSSFL